MYSKKKCRGTFAHAFGHCEVLLTLEDVVVTCGQDGLVRLRHRRDFEPQEGGKANSNGLYLRHGAEDESVTSFCISPKGDALVTTCVLENAVFFWSLDKLTPTTKLSGDRSDKKLLTRFTETPRCSAFSPTGGHVAIGADDGQIKVLTRLGDQFSVVRSFNAHIGSVIALSFDPLGQYLASCGSDGNAVVWDLTKNAPESDETVVGTQKPSIANKIDKFISLGDSEPSEDRKGLYHIDWSPDGQYLAIPNCMHPEAKPKKIPPQISIFRRNTWDVGHSLVGIHPVCSAHFSPNGTYLAAVGGKHLHLWTVVSPQGQLGDVFDRLTHTSGSADVAICSLTWSKKENEISFMDTSGWVFFWPNVVQNAEWPSAFKSNSVALKPSTSDDAAEKDEQKKKEEEEASKGTTRSVESGGSSTLTSPKKKLKLKRRNYALEEGLVDEPDTDPYDTTSTTAPPQMTRDYDEERLAKLESKLNWRSGGEGRSLVPAIPQVPPHPPIQPYSAPFPKKDDKRKRKKRRRRNEDDMDADADGDGEEESESESEDSDEEFDNDMDHHGDTDSSSDSQMFRFLHWSLLGTIVTHADPNTNRASTAGSSRIDISFADKTAHPSRKFRDAFGFTIASLSTHGAIFASPPTSLSRGVVFFRPLASDWEASKVTQEEWTIPLATGETPLGVACGRGWAAVSTSMGHIRTFLGSGVQSSILSFSPPPIALSANECPGMDHLMAVVSQTGCVGQCPSLVCSIVNVNSSTVEASFNLPLTSKSNVEPGRLSAELTWIGWSEDGFLLTCDSTWLVRMCSWNPRLNTPHGNAHSWMPVCQLPSDEATKDRCFVVGASTESKKQILYVNNPNDGWPVVQSSTSGDIAPIPSVKEFAHPSLGLDVGKEAIVYESQWALDRWFESVDHRIVNLNPNGKEMALIHAKNDKNLLLLLKQYLSDDRVSRAADIVPPLRLARSYKIASGLVDRLKPAGYKELLDTISKGAVAVAPVVPSGLSAAVNADLKKNPLFGAGSSGGRGKSAAKGGSGSGFGGKRKSSLFSASDE